MAHKVKMFSIRVPEKLLEDYKNFCDENSINVSKRIRKFMERDVEIWKEKKLRNKNNI
jgi:hypothetical protein